jgi:hypothetical protein
MASKSSSMEELLEIIQSIKKDIKTIKSDVANTRSMVEDIKNKQDSQQDEIREIVTHRNNMVEVLVNNVETKLDAYSNIEYNPTKTAAKKTAAKITTLAFLRKELDGDLYKYADDLYETEDIDNLKKHPDVKKKKSGTEFNNKLISLLHAEIKKTPIEFKKLEEYRDLHIQNMKNDEIID